MKTILATIGVLVFWLLCSLESDARPMPHGWRAWRAAHIAKECAGCGTTEELEIHHILPIHIGGAPMDEANVVTLCGTWCHTCLGHLGDTQRGYDLDVVKNAAEFRRLLPEMRERIKHRDTGGRHVDETVRFRSRPAD